MQDQNCGVRTRKRPTPRDKGMTSRDAANNRKSYQQTENFWRWSDPVQCTSHSKTLKSWRQSRTGSRPRWKSDWLSSSKRCPGLLVYWQWELEIESLFSCIHSNLDMMLRRKRNPVVRRFFPPPKTTRKIRLSPWKFQTGQRTKSVKWWDHAVH